MINFLMLQFSSLGLPELVVILVVLVLLFGGKRLPELAKGLGQSIREFKRATTESQLEEKGETIANAETKKNV
jgi:sec-independent protein translocase protein TatA